MKYKRSTLYARSNIWLFLSDTSCFTSENTALIYIADPKGNVNCGKLPSFRLQGVTQKHGRGRRGGESYWHCQ